MLVILEDVPGAFAADAASALAARLGERGCPAGVVDARRHAWPRRPAEDPGVAGRALVRLAVGMASVHYGLGVRTIVLLTEQESPVGPEAWAFWLRDRAEQRAVILRRPALREGSIGAWAERTAVGLEEGEAETVNPWEPEAPRIETPRLVLTWADREQTREHYRAVAGTSVFDTLTWDGPASEGEMHDRVLHAKQMYAAAETNRPLLLAVIERATGRQIGAAGYRPYAGATYPQGIIGYSLETASQGRGLGTESVAALVRYAFERNGVERIEAEVFVGNHPSRRLLERLGFTLHGTMLAKSLKRGRLMDEWLYALNRQDYRPMDDR